jgi:hypothetical protein
MERKKKKIVSSTHMRAYTHLCNEEKQPLTCSGTKGEAAVQTFKAVFFVFPSVQPRQSPLPDTVFPLFDQTLDSALQNGSEE